MGKIANYTILTDEPLLPTPPEIPEEKWVHARAALISLFKRRFFCSADVAEDLAQETLLRVDTWLKKEGNVLSDDEHAFEKLCYGFAKNVGLEWLHKKTGSEEPPDDDPPAPVNRTLGMNSAEVREFVRQKMALLSDEDRQWINDNETMTIPEMEAKYGLTSSQIAMKVFRARERLRKRFKE